MGRCHEFSHAHAANGQTRHGRNRKAPRRRCSAPVRSADAGPQRGEWDRQYGRIFRYPSLTNLFALLTRRFRKSYPNKAGRSCTAHRPHHINSSRSERHWLDTRARDPLTFRSPAPSPGGELIGRRRSNEGDTAMIDLYAWGTTNGRRALIMVEESGLPFTLHQIDIRNGAQNTEAYAKLNPYRKISHIGRSRGAWRTACDRF